ncbi:phospholipase [[Haemophilus] felis]|uniref:Phospholipase n=1 Tax=[Haemophilus] felis TaxID=123822 RepID=A0A1T0AWC9_9PAST|nr:phospholipase [[Haemophilus] felis]NBI41254.1 phospholipase [[Haemophilus] felis]OOS01762.1 phospholipase [[Haemophilus] felis]
MLKKIFILFLSFCSFSNFAKNIATTFIAEVTPKGAKITAIALQYENNVLANSDLRNLYEVTTSFNKNTPELRTITKAYVNNEANISNTPKSGNFIIIEMDERDKNSDFYSLKIENNHKIMFKAKNENGEIIPIEKIQANKVPQFYKDELQYKITQKGLISLSNGDILTPEDIAISVNRENTNITYIDKFSFHEISLSESENKLRYRLYTPKLTNNRKYPLTLFLHGSGQVGKDNLAHLLSSKGAISTLQYEEGFVVAPQYEHIFDPFDNQGIHWQTNNRHQLIFKILDNLISQYPNIDKNRIYIVGLSRGAEGGLYLLQKRPKFFAGALLMSGREANSVEWIDGNATKEKLSMLKNKPIWFFHSVEDKVSPVKGSRINYHILKEQLKSEQVRYTELNIQNEGGYGIINNNPHNTWDLVFNSPEIINWLLHKNLSSSN